MKRNGGIDNSRYFFFNLMRINLLYIFSLLIFENKCSEVSFLSDNIYLDTIEIIKSHRDNINNFKIGNRVLANGILNF